MRGLAVTLLLLAGEVAAKCLPPPDCGCSSRPRWAAFVRYEFTADGGGSVAVVEHASPDAGLIPELPGGEPGTRALVTINGYTVPLLSDGGLRCGTVTVPANGWAEAVTSGSCDEILAARGVRPYVCRDTGPSLGGCSAPGNTAIGLGLIWLLAGVRRRRRANGVTGRR